MSKLRRHLSSSSCFPEITGIKWAVFIISDNCKRYGLPVTVGDTLIKSDQTNNTPSSCLDLTVSRTCRFTIDDKESSYSNHCCFGRSIKKCDNFCCVGLSHYLSDCLEVGLQIWFFVPFPTFYLQQSGTNCHMHTLAAAVLVEEGDLWWLISAGSCQNGNDRDLKVLILWSYLWFWSSLCSLGYYWVAVDGRGEEEARRGEHQISSPHTGCDHINYRSWEAAVTFIWHIFRKLKADLFL